MRRDGLLDYEWQESDAGPPRKYYQLTAKGKSQLAELNDYWKHLNAHHHAAWEVAMQKVISINLNGNAYQLDESGYDTLREYLARAERDTRGQSRSRRDHGRSRAGDCRQVPALSGPAQDRRDRQRDRSDRRGDGARRHRGRRGRPASAGSSASGAAKGGRQARRIAEAPVPDPRRRDDRRRVQRPRRLLQGRRHVRPNRVRRGCAPHQGRRHHRLRGHDVRHPGGEHARGTRGGRRPAAQREGRDRPREKAVLRKGSKALAAVIGGSNAASGSAMGGPPPHRSATVLQPGPRCSFPCSGSRTSRCSC